MLYVQRSSLILKVIKYNKLARLSNLFLISLGLSTSNKESNSKGEEVCLLYTVSPSIYSLGLRQQQHRLTWRFPHHRLQRLLLPSIQVGANEALPIRAIPGRDLPLHHTLGRWQGRIGRPTLLRSMHDRRQGRSQHHVFTVVIIAMVAAFRDLSPPLVGGSNAASGRGKQVRDFGESRDTHARTHARAHTHTRTHTRTHLTRSTSVQQLFSFFHCWESAFNEELPEAFPPAHNH